MNNKLCGLLGIARRSGHILIGFDAVRAALLADKTQLVILASDCSPKTEKELRFAAENKTCPLVKVEEDKDTLSTALGLQKPVAVIATDDRGFATAMMKTTKGAATDATLPEGK